MYNNYKNNYNNSKTPPSWEGTIDGLDYWTHSNCKMHFIQCRTEAKYTYSLIYFATVALLPAVLVQCLRLSTKFSKSALPVTLPFNG